MVAPLEAQSHGHWAELDAIPALAGCTARDQVLEELLSGRHRTGSAANLSMRLITVKGSIIDQLSAEASVGNRN